MRTSTYIRCQTALYLERSEEFVTHNERGHPLYVREMHYSGGHAVTLSGPSKNAKPDADGSDRGYIKRSVLVPLDDLDAKYREAILDSRRAQIALLTTRSN